MVQIRAVEGRHSFCFHLLLFFRWVGCGGAVDAKYVSEIDKNIMNGVPMAAHGPIFGQNETYRLQEAFERLLSPPGVVFGTKATQNLKTKEKTSNTHTHTPSKG